MQDLDQKCRLPELERAAGRQPRPSGDPGAAREEEYSRIAASSKITTAALQELPVNYSSTKADSKPEEYRAQAEHLVSLYDFHSRTASSTPTSGCASCGRQMKLLKCRKCQEVYYCNRSCQKADFSKHKTVCLMITRLKEEKDSWQEIAALADRIKEIRR